MTEREQLNEELIHLQGLATHQGWELFTNLLIKQAEQVYRDMQRAENPHIAAKHMGAHLAMVETLSLVSRRIRLIQEHLSQPAVDLNQP